MFGWIVLALVVGVGLYVVALYNGLVKARQMVGEGWSGIDVQLKRRADLIPNLIETVKGYATHEKDLFREVTELRTRAASLPAGASAERAQVEGLIGQALGRVMAVAESYPDLKASQNFLEFQNQLEELENQLQMSRRYYNGAVRQLNTAVEQFPGNLVAGKFGFSTATYFEIEDPKDRALPQVKF